MLRRSRAEHGIGEDDGVGLRPSDKFPGLGVDVVKAQGEPQIEPDRPPIVNR